MADLYEKTFPVGPQFYNGQKKFIIELDEYELVNLRWALKKIMETPIKDMPHLHTGDWTGQIRWALDKANTDHSPNSSD